MLRTCTNKGGNRVFSPLFQRDTVASRFRSPDNAIAYRRSCTVSLQAKSRGKFTYASRKNSNLRSLNEIRIPPGGGSGPHLQLRSIHKHQPGADYPIRTIPGASECGEKIAQKLAEVKPYPIVRHIWLQVFEFYPVSVASAPGRFGELRQIVFIRSIPNATRRRLVCRPDHRCGTTVRSFNRRVHLLSASPALLRFQQ
jgi:hypothetical protein